MKIKNWTFCVLVCILLSGCFGDPYDKYLGLWERTDKDGYEVMEITRDGETFLMKGNVLITKDSFGREKTAKSTVLKKSDGQLSTDGFFGDAVFGLSEDAKILRVANQSYKRIDTSRLQEIVSELDALALEKQANKEKCDILGEKYKTLRTEANERYKEDWQQRGKELKALNEKHNDERSGIPNCLF